MILLAGFLFISTMNIIGAYSDVVITNVYSGGLHLEGPHWSTTDNALYWLDMYGQKLFQLDGETSNVTTKDIDYGIVSIVTTVKDNPGVILVAVRSELYFTTMDDSEGDSSLRPLSIVDCGLPDNRINDGKVDANGRLWFGTMGKEEDENVEEDQASLYMLDNNNYLHPEVKVRPVSLSNGIAWSSNNEYMFYIDSLTKNIDVFDFNLTKATISNRRTLFSYKVHNLTGQPDGMTIDSDGNLWVASYGGGEVLKIDSTNGTLLQEYTLPAEKVTSLMWGGTDLATLYVTTSKLGLSETELAEQPEAGSLFAIEGTGSKGLPENQFVFPDASEY